MGFRPFVCLLSIFGVAFNAAAAAGGQWTQGMDDDAGKAAVTRHHRDRAPQADDADEEGGRQAALDHGQA